MDTIAEEIIRRLKAENFIIQRYNSYSTNSIYLKLDYGVAHSIRISDHKGKKHLNYKFNVQSDIKQSYQRKHGKVTRNFYSFNDIDKLVTDVINHRNNKQMKHGRMGYEYYMNKNRFEGQFKKGFWTQAWEV